MDGADPRLEFDFLNGVGFQAMAIIIFFLFIEEQQLNKSVSI
jgi:hypothetical protein